MDLPFHCSNSLTFAMMGIYLSEFIYQFLVNTKDFFFHLKVLVIKHFHKLNTFVNCYTYLLMYACIFYVGEGPTFAFSFTVPRKLVGMYVHNSSPL